MPINDPNNDTLFDSADLSGDAPRPLADLMRPKSFDDVVGQDHLLGNNEAGQGSLTRLLSAGHVPSLIFWGPPGVGKTTMARILASHTDKHFEQLSAIFSGVGDLKKVFETARHKRQMGQSTLLFVDEIHRFNKSQQDAFLPVIEDGTITLIGATTENPSFELNAALLSRCQVMVLKSLDDGALDDLYARANLRFDAPLNMTAGAQNTLKALCDGDGRYFLTMIEQIAAHTKDTDTEIDEAALLKIIQRRAPLYDKGDEAHYNLISALHKSVRGSDVDAALYWFARMLAGGEDGHYIARRMVRMAAEDIGMADPQALEQTMLAWQAYERLGAPEGELVLAQALIYLATAPKSNAAYSAFKQAQVKARETGSLMPPAHILNAPTAMMKDLGYGVGYEYDHDTAEGFSGQNYFPDDMPREAFYTPFERGFERDIQKRLSYWQKIRDKKAGA